MKIKMKNNTLPKKITEAIIALENGQNLLVSPEHKVYAEVEDKREHHINSNPSEDRITVLPSSSSAECCFNNLEISLFCASKSFGRIFNNQIPKCLEDLYRDSIKCLSLDIINLSSSNASSKTSPFEILLGGNIISCPNLDKKENNPLCTFSSNKNFILGRDKFETSFCELSSKFQSRFDMSLGKGGVCFKDFSSSGSIFKHFQNYRNHDSGAFESRLSMADFTVNNNIIINFNSHEMKNDKDIFKSFDLLADSEEIHANKNFSLICLSISLSNLSGRLPEGLTIEKLKGKHESILRNPLIGKNFFLIKYIEQWGTGTNRIIEECIKHGLPEPEFEDTGTSFVITFRKSKLSEEVMKGLNERQKRAIEYLKEHGKIDRKTYCDICNIEKTVAHKELADMVSKELIELVGKGRGAYYILRTKRTFSGHLADDSSTRQEILSNGEKQEGGKTNKIQTVSGSIRKNPELKAQNEAQKEEKTEQK